ncbi:MAG: ATP-binding cassette domain-containing protein [Candidatus Omnitrophica bacterium]|nr:ATP-binding cassette domain-containing protein [Candidatus Omnitrophota bacterium]
MICVSGLKKAFHGQVVLDGIDLQIPSGEVVAVLGSSGTGKSVLLLHLIGLMAPDAGQITIDGVEMTTMSERALLKFRRNIGYLFQEGALYDFLTVAENIAFPLKEHARMRPAAIKAKVDEFLDLIDMNGAGEKYPAELSGGMKKRVALARAMISGPKVLLCDEPTSGLDPIRSRDISGLIRDLSKKLGCTTIMTSHDIEHSFMVADRLVVLNNGRIVIDGTKEALRGSADPFVREFLNS